VDWWRKISGKNKSRLGAGMKMTRVAME
jgi:hypothetical protein